MEKRKCLINKVSQKFHDIDENNKGNCADHRPSDNQENIKETNIFNAIQKGYKPCRNCYSKDQLTKIASIKRVYQ